MMAEEQIQCGKCGGRMTHTTALTYPPIECYKCQKCGRHIDDTPLLPSNVVIIK
jgi:DNA-directed RNA polymerase subunit RPC12/RpoP